jgi:hypothetical protein
VNTRLRHCAGAVVALLVVTLAAACAPRTPDEDSWREDALLALSDVRSSVQAVRVALQQSDEGRLFDSYLQTVTVDSEETAGGSAQKFGGFQPPRAERERYDAVSGQLDAAVSLLSEVRIAVVAHNEGQFAELTAQLLDAVHALDRLDQDLRHPPDDRAGPVS